MAEALGVAGSVVSIVGLAGQVAQGVNYLYTFFNDMQDSPSDIKSLSEELKLVGDILTEVNRDGIDSAPLSAALQRCKEVICDLENLVQRTNLVSAQSSNAKRLWSQMSTAFRNEKFRKYIERLERAKSTLLHAKIQAHGSMHQQQLSDVKTMQESFSRMSLDHSEAITKANATARQTQSDLQTLPSRTKGLIMGEVSTIMATTNTTCSTILTEVRASSARADQSSEELNVAIRSLLSDPTTSRIATLLQPALEKVISDQINSSLEALNAHLQQSQPDRPNVAPDLDVKTSTNNTPRLSENEVGVRSLNQLSATTTSIRWAGTSKAINFWFGRLILSTSILESWENRGNGTLQKAELLETKVTLIPSKWLLRKGAVLTITRLVSAIAAPSIQFSLTPIMVISEDNEILSAMRYRDLNKVHQLILGGKVHPASIFWDGSTLVHKCIDEIREQNIGYWTKGKAKIVGYQALPTETIQAMLKLIEIAVWLVGCGSGPDTLNVYNETAFSALNDVYSSELPSFVFNRSTTLNQLAILILRASRSSPFFVRDPDEGQLKPTKTLVKGSDVYIPMISSSSSPDVSTSFCMNALRLLWGAQPYNKTLNRRRDGPVHRTKQLIRGAVAGKMWLAGDCLESERCGHLLYCSIRCAFVRASPYCPLHCFFLRNCRDDNAMDRHRRKFANSIADMLRIDKDVSTYSKENQSLTDCAVRWRCLDIWKGALEKAECQPLCPEIWNTNAHLYDPLGFVSDREGASIRLTADVASRKVILALDKRHFRFGEYNLVKRRYPRDPKLKNLTNHWPCIIKLPQVHCEVYPSRPYNASRAGGEQYVASESAGGAQSNQYSLQTMEDGGIELFIDCCEIDEPWERICAEVRREQGLDADKSSEDSDSEWSEDSYGDPEINEDKEHSAASTGVLWKIAGVGLDVLSTLV